ncbi:MAG: hypothetical protein M1415_03885 [Firmicutes bacterium]|nr:hypothetical protein [Bacillota bacterium]MCL5063955.1 hypothetical protein [Bacillota bacterium]
MANGLLSWMFHAKRRTRMLVLLALFGPGIMVMLADTDVGSAITAAQ